MIQRQTPLVLDIAKVSLDITTTIGHPAGTFEHESCMGRVLAELAMGQTAHVRSDDRTRVIDMTREEYALTDRRKS